MPEASVEIEAPPQPLAGVTYAGASFLIWGLSPIYWKALAAVPAFEILMHRMIWSFLFLTPLVLLQGQRRELARALTTRSTLAILLVTTLLVGCNWFLFIWAINGGHILQTSLGYYINPLVNVLLGVIFLRERLRRLQTAALALAFGGVFYLTVSYGQFPWVSLALAFSFGFYALIRKVAPVSPLVGLTVETLLLSVPALTYLVYLDRMGAGAFLRASGATSLLLAGAALMTGLPLLLFTHGTKRLHLTTIGFLQYIAPSCTFLLAILVYDEPLHAPQLWTFILIWSALALYSWDAVRHYRNH